MANPLISIIIPTRNRQFYAEKTVEQIAGLGLDIEIIVQDNSDDDSLFQNLKRLNVGDRLKYDYCATPLPFSENYDLAMQQATGEYVCAIGDDDGVLPNIVDCAYWMGEKGIDIIKPAKDQVYFYPGNSNKKKNACLGFGNYSGSYSYSNPESALIALLDDGGCNYLEKKLAGSYHGLVKMEAMQKVKTITGKYYSGLTPDMYSVVCLSLLPDIRFATLDYPVTLPGVCPKSGSAASDSGKHTGKLEEAPHLAHLPDYKWSDLVPRYYAVETIWAETMLYAIRKMGREELIEKYFNSFRLAESLYLNNRNNREEIKAALTSELSNYVSQSCSMTALNQRSMGNLLEKAAIKVSGSRKVIRKLKDINEAVKVFDDQLAKNDGAAPWME